MRGTNNGLPYFREFGCYWGSHRPREEKTILARRRGGQGIPCDWLNGSRRNQEEVRDALKLSQKPHTLYIFWKYFTQLFSSSKDFSLLFHVKLLQLRPLLVPTPVSGWRCQSMKYHSPLSSLISCLGKDSQNDSMYPAPRLRKQGNWISSPIVDAVLRTAGCALCSIIVNNN